MFRCIWQQRLPSLLSTRHRSAVTRRSTLAFNNRFYAIPRAASDRIRYKQIRATQMDTVVRAGSKYVFSTPMLAAWATCCIALGISMSLVSVDQGWIQFASSKKPTDKKDVIPEHDTKMVERLMETQAARKCLENPDEWKRIPYFIESTPGSSKSTLVAGALHGQDKLSVEPLAFLNKDRKQFVFVFHIGSKLCGHDGIVHGGLQATLFDEMTARPAFWNLPRNIALTANLKVNYRRPVLADQVLVIRAQLVNIEGRKATISAQLEDTEGNLLSDAESLYISPSNEKLLPDRSSAIKAIESVYPGNF